MKNKPVWGMVMMGSIGIGVTLLVLLGKSADPPTDTARVAEQTTFEERVQTALQKESKGFAITQYPHSQSTSLVVNQKREAAYSADQPGEEVAWVSEKGGTLSIKPIGSGALPVRLATEGETPYFTEGADTMVVVYEQEGKENKARKGKGYAYRVEGTELVQVWETKGTFEKAYQDGNALVLVERINEDPFNQHPHAQKPHRLIYRKWNGEAWAAVKEEAVRPAAQEAAAN